MNDLRVIENIRNGKNSVFKKFENAVFYFIGNFLL